MKELNRLIRTNWKRIAIGSSLLLAAALLVLNGHEMKTPNPNGDSHSDLSDAPDSGVHAGVEPGLSATSPRTTYADSKERMDSEAAGMPGTTGWDAMDPVDGIAAAAFEEAIYADVQSPARPFGLDVVAPVQVAGGDARSADFAANVLPDILDFIGSNLLQGNTTGVMSAETDASNLTLPNPADVRLYFVGEEAGYHNSIGLNFAGAADDEYTSLLAFPDASSKYSLNPDQIGDRTYVSEDYPTEDYPLVPGDFIDIGAVDAGSFLDLFIIPGGATDGSDAYGVDKTLNADQTSHMRILGVAGDSMLVIGFEDQKNGGDQDFNDVIIAVDVGAQNLQSIAGNLGLDVY